MTAPVETTCPACQGKQWGYWADRCEVCYPLPDDVQQAVTLLALIVNGATLSPGDKANGFAAMRLIDDRLRKHVPRAFP